MFKVLKWILISLGSLVVFTVITNVLKNKPIETDQFNKELKINGKNYELTDKEKAILRAVVFEEISAYSTGAKSVLVPQYEGDTPIMVTANKLQRDYHSNEVTADEKYRNKHLLITGSVDSINRGIGESYSINLKGGDNIFMSPIASMQEDQKKYLASLHKRDTVSLYCTGNGMLIGSALLDDCIPASLYIEKATHDYLNNFSKHLKSNDNSVKKVLFFSRAAVEQLPETSACYASPVNLKKCLSELEKLDADSIQKIVTSLEQKYRSPETNQK